MTTNHKKAWFLFEKRRRAAVDGFDYMSPKEEAASEEGLFLKVMEDVFGPPHRVLKSDERPRGLHA